MNLANSLDDVVLQAKQISIQNHSLERLIPFVDLTSLYETDDPPVIAKLCERAITPQGKVAAVCVYPQFTRQICDTLKATPIKTATVANFPHGSSDLVTTLKGIEQAKNDGADEIDIVMPYQAFLQGDKQLVVSFIKSCKKNCEKMSLKIILETGALQKQDLIYEASLLAIDAGADFIKTSTGKISVGATLEASACMLSAIKDRNSHTGFKASGGIRTPQQAAEFLSLAELLMGKTWPAQNTFRLGTSSLI
jgi:deoxyribose-phosphate aldolase